MALDRINYECTALVGTGKRGILKPDDNGYYQVTLGAFDSFNASNAFYPVAPAKALFDQSSDLQRRIAGGHLRGECGHPKPLPGMSPRDFLLRILRIEEQAVAFHIRSIELVHGVVVDDKGRPVVATLGWIKPSDNNHGRALKASLDNPDENTCFSIRSITNDQIINGLRNKFVKEIVTWDWVVEPGIQVANKYSFPALESLSAERSFSVDHLVTAKRFMEECGLGMESSEGVLLNSLITQFCKTSELTSSKALPSTKW